MTESRSDRAARIRELLATEGAAVAENTRGFNRGRYESVARLEDYEAQKDRARAIKEDAIERLPELLDELTAAVEENGGTVYVADDAADANRYVREVCQGRDADTVVKSKSMTTEELDLNDALAAAGVEVWETDLGEFVVQVADETPSHIIAPAVHKSREAIAALFNERFAPDPPLETAQELTAFAREFLGERIRDADVAVTGANFVVADSGTMALVTSEGNARKCVAAADAHVAVAGIEKVVPTVADLRPFVELIARSGTGQDITSYVSLLTPPVDSPTLDFAADERGGGDREFHLVLVDNGRTALREDPDLRETLYCIRCSACLNSCANFQSVGGHAFGGETYSGGIAAGWEAGVHGLESAASFTDFCTGCTRCVNQCPVRIDVPWLNTVVRDRANREGTDDLEWVYEGLAPDEEPGGLDLQKRFFGNFETVARAGSALAPASNWLPKLPGARALLERTLGVDRRRALPTFRRETFVDWFEARGQQVDPADAERQVVLYPDAYTNYARVERGKAAVRVLEALGVAVDVPAVPESGRAPLSQGMIATARRQAERVAEALDSHVAAGRDVVVVEPSDLAMFRRDYERLLPDADYRRVRDTSVELFEYVDRLLANGADPSALSAGGGPVAYHSHCQQRTLGLERPTVRVLEGLGYDVTTSDVECCGMAGSFGYKSQYYDLSMAVGEQLADQFAGADGTVAASGTSCLEQLASTVDAEPVHPVELLDPGP